MAQSGVVGALRVVLGADTASFEKGLTKAKVTLGTFSKGIDLSAAAIGTAVGTMATAIGAAIQHTINDFDEMHDASIKLGVSTEALSQLRYAAELSGESFDQLTAGFGKMEKAAGAALANTAGPIAKTFERLGVTMAELKSLAPDEIFKQLADGIKALPEGVARASAASVIFGKSWQDNIVLMSEGSKGINEMEKEASLFGLTITGAAAAAGDQFNDNMTRLGAVAKGFAVQLTTAVLPSLVHLSNALVAIGKSTGVQLTIQFIAFSFEMLAKSAEIAAHSLIAAWKAYNQDWAGAGAELDKIGGVLERIWNGETFKPQTGGGTDTSLKPFADDAAATAAALKAAKAAQQEFNKAVGEAKTIYEQTRNPLEKYADELAKINALQAKGVLSAEAASRAHIMAAASVANQYGELASVVGGALSTIFEDNKAVAIAMAIVNTFQAITAALAQYPPPFSFAMAAAQAAAGFAQVMKIKSTTASTKSGSASLGGGGSRRTPAVGGGNAPHAGGGGAGQRAVAITLTGSGRYSRQEVRGLLEQIIEAQGDGAKLILAGA
jgi:hypothetical protein